jgi:hypothetical protein
MVNRLEWILILLVLCFLDICGAIQSPKTTKTKLSSNSSVSVSDNSQCSFEVRSNFSFKNFDSSLKVTFKVTSVNCTFRTGYYKVTCLFNPLSSNGMSGELHIRLNVTKVQEEAFVGISQYFSIRKFKI